MGSSSTTRLTVGRIVLAVLLVSLLASCDMGESAPDQSSVSVPLSTTTTLAPITTSIASTYAVTSAHPAMDASISSPEKLTWWHDGHWWMLADGWYAFRREADGTWVRSGFVMKGVARRSDVRVDPATGDITLYVSRSGPGAAEVGKVTYDAATKTYVSPTFYGASDDTASALPDWDQATHTVDSFGRMWAIGRDVGTGTLHDIVVDPSRLGNGDPVLRGDRAVTAEISGANFQARIVAFSDLTGPGVGILVDNQLRREMQFWRRYDAEPIDAPWTMEIVSRRNFDDHGDVTSTPAGDVLVVYKNHDRLRGNGSANILFARRTAEGTWMPAVVVARKFGPARTDEWTKPQINYDDDFDRVWIAARKRDASGETTFWSAPRLAPSFAKVSSTQLAPGVPADRMTGSASPLSSETGLLVVASNRSDWYGVLVNWR